MSEMKTLKFPGDAEPREIVDAKAREDISKLSDEIANIPSGVGMDITGATVGQIAKITAVDASGVPTAWSPVDMPSGGGGVQPDWNQNDATAADYVKNRPGGYIGETIVYSGTLPSTFGTIEQSFEIVEGQKYYVSTNDGEYIEYTAIKEELSDATYYSFGSITVSEFMNSSSAIDGKFLFTSAIVNGSTMFGGGSGEAAGTTYKVRAVGIVKIPQKYLDIDTKDAITVFASEIDDDALYYYVQNYGSVIFYDDQGYNEKPSQLYDFDKYTVFGAAAPYSYSIRRFMVCENDLTPVIKILEYDSTNDTQKWKFTDIVYPSILMHSSTIGSKKQFKITVNDSGTLTATEVTK